jgi:hypothetical protein
VHLPDEIAHLGEGLRSGFDHHVDAVTEDVELRVGHQHGHLDQGVLGEVQSRHLAVDPDDVFIRYRHSTNVPFGTPAAATSAPVGTFSAGLLDEWCPRPQGS